MENTKMVIANQQDRCKLIHAIVSAPLGSVVVITHDPIGIVGVANSSNTGNKTVQLNAQ